jgi:hypothetical protein
MIGFDTLPTAASAPLRTTQRGPTPGPDRRIRALMRGDTRKAIAGTDGAGTLQGFAPACHGVVGRSQTTDYSGYEQGMQINPGRRIRRVRAAHQQPEAAR